MVQSGNGCACGARYISITVRPEKKLAIERVHTMPTIDSSNNNEGWHHPGGKLLRAGPATLTETELLAVIISAGTSRNPAEKIAEDLIARFHSFEGIAQQPLEELMKIDGLGQVKLCRIAAALEIGRRFANKSKNHSNDLESDG
jgi:DNA repair protein RadC